jgi:carbon storage regulator
MLVLSRKVGQKIVIDERVTITITRIAGGRVSVGIEAPHGVHVRRSELEPHAIQEPPAAGTNAPAPTPNILLPGGLDPTQQTDAGASMFSQPGW